MIYPGGCAVMLKVGDGVGYRFMEPLKPFHDMGWKVNDLKDYHLTLVFVGRNLESHKIQRAVVCAFDLEGAFDVRFTGKLDTFRTGKGRYVVARVESSDAIALKRKLYVEKLSELGLAIDDKFPFKPHVTLAETFPHVGLTTSDLPAV